MLKDFKGKNIIRIEPGINFSFNLISSICAMNRQKKKLQMSREKIATEMARICYDADIDRHKVFIINVSLNY